jgi:hypothetical protein
MRSDWLPTVLHFRVDENTFAQIEREMREEKRTATTDKKVKPQERDRAWGFFVLGIGQD